MYVPINNDIEKERHKLNIKEPTCLKKIEQYKIEKSPNRVGELE